MDTELDIIFDRLYADGVEVALRRLRALVSNRTAERDQARARVLQFERAIEAEWAAWYAYDSDPMRQEADMAHAADAALWALIGKEPAP